MKSVNLVPAARRDAKRRRKHRVVCAAACGAYGLLLACAVGGAHLLWSGSAMQVDQELAVAEADIQRLQRQGDAARAELVAARTTIEANRTVAEQPDWSVLLVLLGKTTGDDVVLRSVSVAPPSSNAPTTPAGSPKPGSPAAKPQPEVILDISGIGQTQLAVQQHVLRLEETGLFSKVSLLDTGRQAFLNGNAIAFRLQCVFGEARGQHSPPRLPALTSTDVGGTTR